MLLLFAPFYCWFTKRPLVSIYFFPRVNTIRSSTCVRLPRAASVSPPRTTGQEDVLSPPRATAAYLHLFAFQNFFNLCSLFWPVQGKDSVPFWRLFSSSIQKRRTTCLQIRPCTWNWTWNLELLQVILLIRYVWEASPNPSLVVGSKIFCTTFCSFMGAFDLTKASVALNQHEVYSNNSLVL